MIGRIYALTSNARTIKQMLILDIIYGARPQLIGSLYCLK